MDPSLICDKAWGEKCMLYFNLIDNLSLVIIYRVLLNFVMKYLYPCSPILVLMIIRNYIFAIYTKFQNHYRNSITNNMCCIYSTGFAQIVLKLLEIIPLSVVMPLVNAQLGTFNFSLLFLEIPFFHLGLTYLFHMCKHTYYAIIYYTSYTI